MKSLILLAFVAIPLINVPVIYNANAEPLPQEVILRELTVPEKIEQKAIEYNLDPKLMTSIAYAESHYNNVPNYKYTNENGYYTAWGIFQITRTTYKAFCGNPDERKDIDKNIECAMIIASTSGTQHWSESKSNW